MCLHCVILICCISKLFIAQVEKLSATTFAQTIAHAMSSKLVTVTTTGLELAKNVTDNPNILALDIGNYAVVATYWDVNTVQFVPVEFNGKSYLPFEFLVTLKKASYKTRNEHFDVLFGKEFEEEMAKGIVQRNVGYLIKPLIGLSIEDERVKQNIRDWNLTEVKETKELAFGFHKSTKSTIPLPLRYIYKKLIQYVKDHAETQSGKSFDRIIWTCPVDYLTPQIDTVESVLEEEGFQTILRAKESTAAALYSLVIEQRDITGKIQLVIDIGRGTTDISVVMYVNGVIHTLDSHGNTHLGGQNFTDTIIMRAGPAIYESSNRINDGSKKKAKKLTTLKEVVDMYAAKYYNFAQICDLVKQEFSNDTHVEEITKIVGFRTALPFAFDRESYTSDTAGLVEQLLADVDIAIENAKKKYGEEFTTGVPFRIDTVILVGGGCREYQVRAALGERFKGTNMVDNMEETFVARGAGYWSIVATAQEEDKKMQDEEVAELQKELLTEKDPDQRQELEERIRFGLIPQQASMTDVTPFPIMMMQEGKQDNLVVRQDFELIPAKTQYPMPPCQFKVLCNIPTANPDNNAQLQAIMSNPMLDIYLLEKAEMSNYMIALIRYRNFYTLNELKDQVHHPEHAYRDQ
jgi:molecular chaperone DnaK (HSP70)